MAVLLTAQQLNEVFKPVTELTKTIANSALVQPVKNVAAQLPSQNSMMASGLGGSPVAQALANLNFPLEETKEAVEESSNQAQKIESESSSIAGDKLDNILSTLQILKPIKGLIDRIEMSVRDATKIAEAEGKRAQRNKAKKKAADDAAKMKAIEDAREEKEGDGDEEPGKAEKVPDKSGGISGLFDKIPGFKMVKGLFAGGARGITKIFGKLFFPITIVMGILSFVEGFIKGKEEGGIGEGITQGFEMLINNLIDVPLNMLKDLLAWALGALGFDEASEQVAGFDINISAIVRPIADFFSMIGNIFSNIAVMVDDALNYASDLGSKALDKINPMNWFGGDDEEEVVEKGRRGGRKKKTTPRVTPKSLEATGNIGAIDDLAKATPASAAVEIKSRISPEEMSEKEQEAAPAKATPATARKKFKDLTPEERKERTRQHKVKRETGRLEKLKASRSELERDAEVLSEGIAGGDTDPQTQKNLNNIIASAAHYDKLIKAKESELEVLKGGDIRGAAAGRMQDAGIAKAGAGGGPTVVNAPVTNVQEGTKTSVGMHHSPDLTTDLSLTQVNAAAMP